MSSVVSGFGKVFKAVGNTVSKVSSSVSAIGKATFAATTATSAPAVTQGGFALASQALESGGNVLPQILNSASRIVGVTPEVVSPNTLSSTATQTLLSPNLSGGLGSGLNGGTNSFNVMGPATQATAANTSAGLGDGFNGNSFQKLLESPITGNILEGVGGAMQKKAENEFIAGERQKARDFEQQQYEQVRDSYNVDPSVYKRGNPREKTRVKFDQRTGMIESR